MTIPALQDSTEVIPTVPTKFDPLKETENTKYFQSKEHEIAFYFKMNIKDFDLHLGIKQVHAKDVKKAKELKNLYLRMFHPDRKQDSDSNLNYDEICVDINFTFQRVTSGKL